MKKTTFLLAIVVILFSNIYCKKTRIEGTVKGTVQNFTDEYGNQKDVKDIKIVLTASKLDEDKVTYTDADGKFEFNEVLTGGYDLIIGESAPLHNYFTIVGGEKPLVFFPFFIAEKSISKLSIIDYSSSINYWGETEYLLKCIITPQCSENKKVDIAVEINDVQQYNCDYEFSENYDTVYVFISKSLETNDKIKISTTSFAYHNYYRDTLGNRIDPAASVYGDSIIIK